MGNPGTNTLTISTTGSVATTYDAQSGSATPSSNVLNIYGNGSITSVASGNTVTLELTGLTSNAILVGAGTTTIGLLGPTDSGVVTTGATGVPAITSLASNGELIIGSSAGAPAAATLTAGTGISITNGHNSISIAVNGSVVGETITGNTGGALSPTAGNWDILGNYVLSGGGAPLATSGSGSTLLVNVQLSEAAASSSANNAGVASFSSAEFAVDANGYVTLSPGAGYVATLTGNSGGAISPSSGNINTVGTGSITIVGSGSTLTTELTGLTAHNVLLGEGTATVGLVAPSATSGVPLISQGASSDPIFGTALVAGGGTGDTSFTAYAPIAGGTSTTGALQSASTGISTSGFVFTSTGASSLPSFQSVSASGAITTIDGDSGSATPSSGVITISGGTTGLTTSASGSTVDLTGTLKLANGGTNASLTASNGGIFYSTASAGAILAGTATADQVLLSGASTTPAWSTATYPATTTINQILYSSSANVISGLATADNGVLITGTTGIPSILADGTTGQVLTATTGSPPSWTSIVTGVSSVTGTANQILASPTTGAVVLSLIGPYTPATYPAHSVLIGEGTSSIVGVGPTATAGQILQSAGSSSDPAFSTATYPSTTTINQLLYSSSANVVAGLATANNATLTTGATGVPVLTSLAANGDLLIGSASGPPLAATLTAGTGVTITNAANSITIAATGGAFTWHDVTGGSATLVAQNGYLADSASLTTFTLPTNNAIGDTIIIMGKGVGGWTIVYGTGQYIQFGNAATTTTTGNLASTNTFDTCTLVCITASVTAPIFGVNFAVGNLSVT